MSNLPGLDAVQAFVSFCTAVLEPARASRFRELSRTDKGRGKLLSTLSHEFESAVKPGLPRSRSPDDFAEEPGYVFTASIGFGAPYPTVREAIESLDRRDDWLIVLADGQVGVLQPESWIDRRRVLVRPGPLAR